MGRPQLILGLNKVTINSGFGLIGLLAVAACAASAAEQGDDFLYSFLPGSYAVIGQMPDGGAAYAGTAEIIQSGPRLRLVKHIGAVATEAEGHIERASPGEAKVLRVIWDGRRETCLIHTDLDNYGRLTCYWTVNGVRHRSPGLEAFFSTGQWR